MSRAIFTQLDKLLVYGLPKHKHDFQCTDFNVKDVLRLRMTYLGHFLL